MSVDEYIVINCWVYGQDQFTDTPDCVLGPYSTRAAADSAAQALTCSHQITVLRLRLDPPEWAKS